MPPSGSRPGRDDAVVVVIAGSRNGGISFRLRFTRQEDRATAVRSDIFRRLDPLPGPRVSAFLKGAVLLPTTELRRRRLTRLHGEQRKRLGWCAGS
jgi:hypothetical protein